MAETEAEMKKLFNQPQPTFGVKWPAMKLKLAAWNGNGWRRRRKLNAEWRKLAYDIEMKKKKKESVKATWRQWTFIVIFGKKGWFGFGGGWRKAFTSRRKLQWLISRREILWKRNAWENTMKLFGQWRNLGYLEEATQWSWNYLFLCGYRWRKRLTDIRRNGGWRKLMTKGYSPEASLWRSEYSGNIEIQPVFQYSMDVAAIESEGINGMAWAWAASKQWHR